MSEFSDKEKEVLRLLLEAVSTSKREWLENWGKELFELQSVKGLPVDISIHELEKTYKDLTQGVIDKVRNGHHRVHLDVGGWYWFDEYYLEPLSEPKQSGRWKPDSLDALETEIREDAGGANYGYAILTLINEIRELKERL